MNNAKQIAVYAGLVLGALVCALLIDGIAVMGSLAYAFPYPASRFCSTVGPGVELKDAERKMLSLGRPDRVEYSGARLTVASEDSQCNLDVDPATNRVLTVKASPVPIQY